MEGETEFLCGFERCRNFCKKRNFTDDASDGSSIGDGMELTLNTSGEGLHKNITVRGKAGDLEMGQTDTVNF